jgi:hypothetical protein
MANRKLTSRSIKTVECSYYGPNSSPNVGNYNLTPLKTLSQEAGSHSAVVSQSSSSFSPRHVMYVSGFDLRPSYVSGDLEDVLAVSANQFLGSRSIWNDIIPMQDRAKVFSIFKDLDRVGEVAFTHRILHRHSIPIWVSHQVRATVTNGIISFIGWITPITNGEQSGLVESSIISNFVHKLGNHFQLINLALDSARKGGSKTQDVDIVQETLDKTIALTLAFSEFTQPPAWVSAFDLMEAVDNATFSGSCSFNDSPIEIDRHYASATKGLTIQGDPYLLELAIGAILKNAVEASKTGGKIRVKALLQSLDDDPAAVKLVFTDEGAGIEECNLSKVTIPFFSTKANHYGLGLSMAARFVEIHRGILSVTSEIGKGTEVEIILPLNGHVDDACH